MASQKLVTGVENDVVCVNNTDILVRRAVLKRECWSQTLVQNTKVVEVPANKILQTEAIHWPLDNITKRPLLLVKHYSKYLIADGNHRYAKRLQRNQTMRAYLLENNKELVKVDDNTANWINAWVEDKWSWSEFKDVLLEAADEVANKIKEIRAYE